VKLICELIKLAIKGFEVSGLHLISVDEKPSIQALYKKQIPMEINKPCRIESEYKRNGKTCLIAGWDIGTGKVLSHDYTDKNDEAAFTRFVKQTVPKYENKGKLIFLADNLRTHTTATLVEFIAEQINYKHSLGKKGKIGILKSIESRRVFLQDNSHRIYFVYTPKHCSWLNPIENWFSTLQRRVISRGNFNSVEDLISKIEAYINFYNKTIFKRINWHFSGFTKLYPLRS
jgi:transposase